MIEVHVGLPKGVGQPELFKGFESSQVFDTRPGPSAAQEYEGHGVDGELGAILTAWPDITDLRAFTTDVVGVVSRLPGARLEYEKVGRFDVSEVWTALGGLMGELEAGEMLTRVPAPRYERHFKVRDGRSPEELLEAMSGLLVDHEHFELTIFGPENPKAIVTIAANELDDITTQSADIREVLKGENMAVGPIEELVGAWRPAA